MSQVDENHDSTSATANTALLDQVLNQPCQDSSFILNPQSRHLKPSLPLFDGKKGTETNRRGLDQDKNNGSFKNLADEGSSMPPTHHAAKVFFNTKNAPSSRHHGNKMSCNELALFGDKKSHLSMNANQLSSSHYQPIHAVDIESSSQEDSHSSSSSMEQSPYFNLYLELDLLPVLMPSNVSNQHFVSDIWRSRLLENRGNNSACKYLRQEIMISTILLCCACDIPPIYNSVMVQLLSSLEKGSRFEDTSAIDVTKFPSSYQTYVCIYNADSIDVGLHLKRKGYHPLVLNMANAKRPGGGYLKGSAAQEETLFRRTNYYRHLDYGWKRIDQQVTSNWTCSRRIGSSEMDDDDELDLEPQKTFHFNSLVELEQSMYPISEKGGAIYSPNVMIFRENEARGYEWMKEFETLSFIAVPACQMPSLSIRKPPPTIISQSGQLLSIQPSIEEFIKRQDGLPFDEASGWLDGGLFLSDQDRTLMKEKIISMLKIALEKEHDSIVLGAFGCGAFGNPPHQVAQLFHQVILTHFQNKFRVIAFAILEDANSYQSHNVKGNIIPFQKVLNLPVLTLSKER